MIHRYIAWLLLFSWLTTIAHAAPTSPQLSISAFESDKGTLTPEHVLALTDDFGDIGTLKKTINTSKWLLVTWDKHAVQETSKNILINDMFFRFVSYYPIKNGTIVDEWIGGHRQNVDSRPNPQYHKFYADISNYDAVLMKIDGHVYIQTMMQLISEDQLNNRQTFELSWYSAFYAVISCMVLYNFLIYVYLREKKYLYYCLYLVPQIITQLIMTGIGRQYVWSGFTFYSSDFNIFIFICAIASTLLFVRSFLDPTHFSRWKLWMLKVQIAFSAFCLVGHLFVTLVLNSGGWLFVIGMALNAVIMRITVYVILIDNLRHNDGNSKVIFIIYSILMIGGNVTFIGYLGWIEPGVLTQYAFDVAIVLEAVILSLVLAHTIDGLRKDKLQAEIQHNQLQRQFTRQLLSVQEAEKKLLGRTLHDDFTHRLLTIKNNLAQKLGSNDGEVKNVAQCLDDIRDLSHRIHPHVVERLGLPLALIDICNDTEKSHVFDITHTIDDISFSHEHNILVYRIVQESLSNIIKHADASEVLVALRREQSHITLMISDDGNGFDGARTTGFGLSSIRERVDMLGATMVIESTHNGTSLIISIPVSTIPINSTNAKVVL